MKKFLFLCLFCVSFETLATPICRKFQLIGDVSIKEKEITFTIAKSTASEKVFVFPKSEQYKAAPYDGHMAKIDAILSSASPREEARLLRLDKIESVVPDPLNQNSQTVKTLLGEVKCP